MSIQNVTFTDPSEISSLKSQVNEMDTTQWNIAGAPRQAWTGAALFIFASMTTVQTETWKHSSGNLQATKCNFGDQPLNNVYKIRSFRQCQSYNINLENVGGGCYHGVIDEDYYYYFAAFNLTETGVGKDVVPNTATYQAYVNLFYHFGIIDFAFGHNATILKMDRYTMKVVASLPARSISGPIYTADSASVYNSSIGTFEQYPSQMTSTDDYIYTYTVQKDAQLANSFLRNPNVNYYVAVKIRKDTMTPIWLWQPPLAYGDRPYFGNGVQARSILAVPAAGSRSEPYIVTTCNSVWQYSSTWGVNLMSPGLNEVLGYQASGTNAAAYEFVKFNPGYWWPVDSMWALRDMGGFPIQQWKFTSNPTPLVVGQTLPSECFVPAQNKVHLYYNLWDSGNTGTVFQYGTSTGGQLYDTRGLRYAASGATRPSDTVTGHWLFSSYTGYLFDFPGVTSTIFNNDVCFIDFLDADNSTQLKSGNRFSTTGTYKGYKMIGGDGNAGTPVAPGLWSRGTGALSLIVDYANPIMVPGAVLEKQPMVKRFFTGAIGTSTLDAYDVNALQYYGAAFYGDICWDPVLDRLYAGTTNGQLGVLDDLINTVDFVFNGQPSGRYNDRSYSLRNKLVAMNATGSAFTEAAFWSFQYEFEEFKNRQDAQQNIVRSPRCNRYLHSSIIALDMTNGAIKWADKQYGWDGYDWNFYFWGSSINFFWDAAANGDGQACMLVQNPLNRLLTTNGRMLLTSTKDIDSFYDPDAAPIRALLPSPNYPSETLYFEHGITTTSTLPPKGPRIAHYWHPDGGHELFEFNDGATNGSRAIFKNNACKKWGNWNAGGSNDPDQTVSMRIYNPALGGTGSYSSYVPTRAGHSQICVYNLFSRTGPSELYGSMATGPCAMPYFERLIEVAPDLCVMDGRGGLSLYNDVALVAHQGAGAYLGYDITNGQEVWRQFVGYNTYASPIPCNDIIYSATPRYNNNIWITDPVTGKLTLTCGQRQISNFTLGGI
jgi:hypothetical protein